MKYIRKQGCDLDLLNLRAEKRRGWRWRWCRIKEKTPSLISVLNINISQPSHCDIGSVIYWGFCCLLHKLVEWTGRTRISLCCILSRQSRVAHLTGQSQTFGGLCLVSTLGYSDSKQEPDWLMVYSSLLNSGTLDIPVHFCFLYSGAQ